MKKKSPNKSASSSPRVNWNFVLLAAVIAAAFLLLLLTYLLPAPDAKLSEEDVQYAMQEANFALEQKQFAIAEQMAASVPNQSPLFEKSRLIAGEAATRNNQFEVALKYYAEIAEGTSEDALTAAFAMGEIYRVSAHLEKAIQSYEHVLENSNHLVTHEHMAFLTGITGQRWKTGDHLFELIKQGNLPYEQLAIFADLERSIEQPEFVRMCAEQTPNEPLSQMAIAAQKVFDGQTDQAQPILEKVIAARPDLVAAQAMLGKILVVDDPSEFSKWHEKLPAEADGYADIWFIRGSKARADGNHALAAGCFAEALRLQSEYRLACYQLGQSLNTLGSPDAEMFVERAKLQAELGQMVDQVLHSKGASVRALQRVTEISESLGRIWEARAWAIVTLELHPNAKWVEPIIARCSSQLQPNSPRSLAAANMLQKSDLKEYVKLARAQKLAPMIESTDEPQANLSSNSKIRFEREEHVGVDFVYNNGPDLATTGVRMFEQTGGGVGIIDYDNDGLPDIYFTQGANWKTGEDAPILSSDVHDCLYRNADSKRFAEVSTTARIVNLEFTQGIAVADYDSDGFDDILLGQFGPNQLWRNNGDGTFSNQSEALGVQTSQWTTSCAMVDLNGDSLLDIYEVNYLQGPDIYQLICGDIGCAPTVFDGSQDQLRINRGDGTFELIPDACPKQQSKGLGVLAFALGTDRTPSLFIANDQVPNFLLIPESLPDGTLKLNDEALLRGVAFNVDGLAMAGMGVAADDINHNGLIDLFVTNFFDEANTLYLQDTPGLFSDRTQNTGMLTTSLPYVGWGTQFLDADLDTQSDVIVINGNVDDYRPRGGEYAMLPQFFRNHGNTRFKLSNSADIGDFFSEKHLGRALAKLDWNGDGKMDFVVSIIGDKAALVTNRSEEIGSYLNFRLIGTKSARTPIGTSVTVTTDAGVWTKQLTAGDGFQASNQRMIQFGLGDAQTVRKVEVIWPSGAETVLGELPTNLTVELVENSGAPGLIFMPK